MSGSPTQGETRDDDTCLPPRHGLRVINRLIDSGTATYDACDYDNADFAPAAVQKAVVTLGGHVDAPPDQVTWPTWTLHPAAMPRGSALLIASWRPVNRDDPSAGAMLPMVLRTDRLPVCVPNRAPRT